MTWHDRSITICETKNFTWNVVAVVRVLSLSFYLDNLSSNPAEAVMFYCIFCDWIEKINKRRSGLGHLKKSI